MCVCLCAQNLSLCLFCMHETINFAAVFNARNANAHENHTWPDKDCKTEKDSAFTILL